MPPRRITRRSVVSPSPVLSDVGTPKPGKQRGLRVPVEQVRNQTPTRFSLSYGSSLIAIPDRNKTAAGLGLEAAFAEIGETVRTDNIKAERRRRELDARRGSTTPGPRRPDPIREETGEEKEEEEDEEEEVEEKDEEDDDQGGYYDDEEEEDSELERQRAEEEEREREEEEEREREEEEERERAEKAAAAAAAAERERKRLEKERKDKAEREKAERALKAAREAEEREAKKRAREEGEEEAKRAEQARAERAARLRRERAEEARRQAEQKHAEEARRQAEQKRAEEAARREEEQRQAREAAMRPPSPPSKRLLSTPPPVKRRELVPPDTGNSYIEESDVYNDSETVLEEERQRAQQRRLAAQYTPEPPEPPRIARRPASTLSNSLPLAQYQVDQQHDTFDTETEPMVSDKSYPSFGKVSQPTTPRPSRTSRPVSEQSNTTNGKTPPPPYTPAPTFMQRSLDLVRRSLWVAWKLLTYLVPLLLIALIVLSATSYGSPDSDNSIRWYGWKHWRSNIGQFIPSHPQLTDDQFNDLKDYMLEQSSSTESAVKNIQTLLPRMVHVKRGPNGDLIIQDDFWHALLDKMLKDSSILTLDGTGTISEEHWDALRPRLVKAGLFEKGPSDEHILQLAEGTVSKSWERWVAKNGEKVAQVVKEHLPRDTGDGVTRDAAISRDEFVGLLRKRIAEHKEDIDERLDTVKKGLETLIDTTVKAAISNPEGGGLSKSEITTLVRNIVKKEIPRAQLEAAAKDGIMRNYHDYIESQVNHFGLGNQAGIVYSESSPTYRQGESQALPGHKHLSKLFGKPKPITSKDQTSLEAEYMLALSAWTDVGQCWCAGITVSRGAELAVEMANIVIPQVVVIEHAHPNATTDRGSMPKDIEVWGYYPDPDDNKRLLAWMDELYPGEREADLKKVDADDKNKPLSLVNKKYVKIGELEYDYAKTSGNHGMFVHKLSEELLDLDAATYKVLVRAKTNHGSPDHTCFYRLQLFGEEVEFENGS